MNINKKWLKRKSRKINSLLIPIRHSSEPNNLVLMKQTRKTIANTNRTAIRYSKESIGAQQARPQKALHPH